MEFKLSLR